MRKAIKLAITRETHHFQTNKYVLVHPYTPRDTYSQTHVHPFLSEHSNSSFLSSKKRFHPQGEHHAPLLPPIMGPGTESTATFLIQSHCLRENQTLFTAGVRWAVPVMFQHLNHHVLKEKEKWPQFLVKKDLMQFRWEMSFHVLLFHVILWQRSNRHLNPKKAHRPVLGTSSGSRKAYRFNLFAIYCARVHNCVVCARHSAFCKLARIAIIHHGIAPANGCVKKPAFFSAISHSYLL